jgi:transaldolase
MGASFRNTSQITELAGCDFLTISPSLLQQLQDTPGDVQLKLTKENADASKIEKISLNEGSFRFMLNDDAMATEKTAEGIRQFSADIVKLEELINSKMEGLA